ncbi:hypothetical protein OIE66_41330 [Nonomuraea sp. NBC_01738]|uniref:hypothetical protein n=1 Tax=Nonomuraea sp. NBC_01738 TaxID=2976003 RepID=UPI002E158401|nr:hypothetical protein OIE66_41330 [Nonomuraea sp. NBC_01738]
MNEPDQVILPNGELLHCVVCKNDRFYQNHWKLQTTGMTFFNLDWANRDATCFVCDTCSYIHWFNLL